jgi:hypothetical protein
VLLVNGRGFLLFNESRREGVSLSEYFFFSCITSKSYSRRSYSGDLERGQRLKRVGFLETVLISIGGDVAVGDVKGYHSGTVKDVVVRVRRSRSLRWGGCRNLAAEQLPLRREDTKKDQKPMRLE